MVATTWVIVGALDHGKAAHRTGPISDQSAVYQTPFAGSASCGTATIFKSQFLAPLHSLIALCQTSTPKLNVENITPCTGARVFRVDGTYGDSLPGTPSHRGFLNGTHSIMGFLLTVWPYFWLTHPRGAILIDTLGSPVMVREHRVFNGFTP